MRCPNSTGPASPVYGVESSFPQSAILSAEPRTQRTMVYLIGLPLRMLSVQKWIRNWGLRPKLHR